MNIVFQFGSVSVLKRTSCDKQPLNKIFQEQMVNIFTLAKTYPQATLTGVKLHLFHKVTA